MVRISSTSTSSSFRTGSESPPSKKTKKKSAASFHLQEVELSLENSCPLPLGVNQKTSVHSNIGEKLILDVTPQNCLKKRWLKLLDMRYSKSHSKISTVPTKIPTNQLLLYLQNNYSIDIDIKRCILEMSEQMGRRWVSFQRTGQVQGSGQRIIDMEMLDTIEMIFIKEPFMFMVTDGCRESASGTGL
ncbi:unnamed protein product [Darwinula stevensoni]|uniref:Uncharacterized protein n=1 Tax=Darwinula stevensoni TaxID=69355 RepID=A0A7R8XJK7_9CRUS|nr:unnamed protein product [Darwinula stevensoni]CAG0894917.1 unnamed protein product [Darwinula stevensoni]